jgi:hypothetical protein
MGSSANPYSSRLPVIDPERFYGRHEIISQVARGIADWQIVSISGEPRIGKTSLLYHLTGRGGAGALPEFSAAGGQPNECLSVLIELRRLPVRNALGFWRYLLGRVSDEVQRAKVGTTPALAERFGLGRTSVSDDYEAQTNFESYLRALQSRVILLFDDFDILFEFEVFQIEETKRITDQLRTFKQSPDLEHQLNLIIVTAGPLVDLFRTNQLLALSPFPSSISQLIPLGLLDEEAVDDVIQAPWRRLADAPGPFSRDDVAFVRWMAGRHPDFLNICCFHLYEARATGSVDYAQVRRSIDDDGSALWTMDRLWARIERTPPLREALVALAQGRDPADADSLSDLEHRGLVDASTTPPRIFGEIFRTFILDKVAGDASAAGEPSRRHLAPGAPTAGVSGNGPPSLSPREARLYAYLREHLGRTCSRADLERAVWGNDAPRSPDALQQLAKRLRRKIERDPARPELLVSVHGQGYELKAPMAGAGE